MSEPITAQFDEMHAPDGSVREAYRDYQQWLSEQDPEWMRRKAGEALQVGHLDFWHSGPVCLWRAAARPPADTCAPRAPVRTRLR